MKKRTIVDLTEVGVKVSFTPTVERVKLTFLSPKDVVTHPVNMFALCIYYVNRKNGVHNFIYGNFTKTAFKEFLRPKPSNVPMHTKQGGSPNSTKNNLLVINSYTTSIVQFPRTKTV